MSDACFRLHAEGAGVAEWARNQPLVRRAYLFGSRVRGDHRPDSDLDVALLVSGEGLSSADATFIHYAQQWRDNLAALLPFRLHMVQALPTDRYAWRGIKQDGWPVYKRS